MVKVKKNSMKKKKVPPKRKARPQKVKKGSVLGWCIKWLFVLGIWGGIIGGSVLAWYGAELPRITKAADFERRNTIIIKDRHGEVIGRYGDLRGQVVSIADLPAYLPQAVIAIEDRRFYQHKGVDPLGIARALIVNTVGGGVRQGGSTITQQLAKNLFLSHQRTLKRKIQEAMLAIWLERELSKDEILSAYLNRVYLGSGAYGVDAAAQLYFGKSARDVNVQEAALLAGLLKAPSRFSPHNNADKARARAQVVLRAMLRNGYITQAQADGQVDVAAKTAVSMPLAANRARYFADWVMRGLDDVIGSVDADMVIGRRDLDLQRRAENALARFIVTHGVDLAVSQGAIMVMRDDGAVLAMVGGANYSASQFNRAVQARRQPGSAFKPILYASALEQGWLPEDMILDAPFSPDEYDYTPRNFNDEYAGEVTLMQALAGSANTASVRLMAEVGPRRVSAKARDMGIKSAMTRDLSLALGSAAVTMEEILTSYAVISNDGRRVAPFGITRIESPNGERYYKRRSSGRKRVLDRDIATQMQAMLRAVVVQGTGRGAALGEARIAMGKTGTSQNSRDAWFVGFTDEGLTAAVWLGNDDNAPMNNVTGGSWPARLWAQVMGSADPRSLRRGYEGGSGLRGLLNRILSGGAEPSREERSRYND